MLQQRYSDTALQRLVTAEDAAPGSASDTAQRYSVTADTAVLHQEVLVLGADSDTACVTSDTAQIQHRYSTDTADTAAVQQKAGCNRSDTAVTAADTAALHQCCCNVLSAPRATDPLCYSSVTAQVLQHVTAPLQHVTATLM